MSRLRYLRGPIDILASMCNMDKRYGFCCLCKPYHNKDIHDLKRIPKNHIIKVKKHLNQMER